MNKMEKNAIRTLYNAVLSVGLIGHLREDDAIQRITDAALSAVVFDFPEKLRRKKK